MLVLNTVARAFSGITSSKAQYILRASYLALLTLALELISLRNKAPGYKTMTEFLFSNTKTLKNSKSQLRTTLIAVSFCIPYLNANMS